MRIFSFQSNSSIPVSRHPISRIQVEPYQNLHEMRQCSAFLGIAYVKPRQKTSQTRALDNRRLLCYKSYESVQRIFIHLLFVNQISPKSLILYIEDNKKHISWNPASTRGMQRSSTSISQNLGKVICIKFRSPWRHEKSAQAKQTTKDTLASAENCTVSRVQGMVNWKIEKMQYIKPILKTLPKRSSWLFTDPRQTIYN